MNKKVVFILALSFLIFPACILAQDIPSQVKSQLESKNIPLYPGVIYCTGEASLGVRFASNEDPGKVRAWYKAKYPKWAVMDQYGSWTLYDGPPGAGMAQLMSAKRIEIKANEQLPSWHSLSSEMTTEVLIAFPD